jgi:hypothetical protein
VSRTLKRTLLVALAIVTLAQLVGPARTNPATNPTRRLTNYVKIPADVDAILTRSCNNCHSNETRWPWYAYVAPMSWSVIGHVRNGRDHLNFSAWPSSPEEGIDLLDSVCQEVKRKRMPLASYTWMHWDAALSDADRKVLCRWANRAADDLAEAAGQ